MIKEKIGINTNINQLAALHQEMQANNDPENAEKILDLHQKLVNEELIISFSGHFSAGKSSIINTLVGQDILPKSPIPTSANIVKMTSGEGWARVFFNDKDPVEYKEPYDIDMIKEYSKDKDTIKKIEISTAKNIIPKGAAIIDTPGIDAADDADRLMTEGALHLVDVLFYVMDYNHVQSEVNLYFLQSLQDNNIPFYLIINQIDKHNERELSFASYAKRIKETFTQWEIKPKDVFFTSLFDFAMENNQFDNVKETLFSMMEGNRKQYFNIDASVNQVINKHKKFLKDQYEALFAESSADEELGTKLAQIQELESTIKELTEEPQKLEKVFQSELNNTLKNAYLMPKDLRDKAHKFLESEQHGFKVGLIGAKKKTEEEKAARLSDFKENLQGTIESAIQWKLRDKFLNLARDFSITDTSIQEKINNLSLPYGADELKKIINPSAQVNGDYVLNYTNDVASDIKAKFRRKALEIATIMKVAIEEKNKDRLQDYQATYDSLQEAQALKEKHDKVQQELKMKQETIDYQLRSPNYNQEDFRAVIEAYEISHNNFIIEESPVELRKEKPQTSILEVEQVPTDNAKAYTMEHIHENIDDALKAIEGLPGFNDLTKDLVDKKDRLSNRSYTIALFGAFSAGKSSFSNALIGERVLPVSPNPTTATVNRIRPVTAENPHGTVVVTMKNEETLFRELHDMTSKFSPVATNFTELIEWIIDKKIHQHENLNNMYQAYIQALITGYESNQASIAKQVTISLNEFAIYVTDETKACYIEEIDLYYACAITNQGITLVDTPGADSVNARHTNVAFNYIKHADAILYVTYYNHALSRADRDFLMQLGRVKEVFQLDKMFFIVNAADLAESEEELNLVTTYVNNELIKLGIRQAKLFPVSSKLSLEEKLEERTLNDQMQAFEKDFYSFIHHDLAELIIESALWDINRIYHTMEHYIASINLDAAEKEKQKQEISRGESEVLQFVSSFETTVYEQQIKQRIEKQLFYVVERLGIRFHDMFKEMFNPTTITENGRKATGELKNALENLLEYVRFELNQELQAVSLRVEAYTTDLSDEVYNKFKLKSVETNALFELPNEFDIVLHTPEYEVKFQDLSIADFNHILKKYKGTKAFFEKNEKEVMKDELYSVLVPSAENFIEKNELLMNASYIEQWQHMNNEMKETAANKLKQHVQNYFAMLEAPVDFAVLRKNLETLEKIVQQYEVGEVL